MAMGNVPRCQHIKINGTQCGSPALRWRRQCFFHERVRREQAKNAKDVTVQRRFELPLLEDANSVQVGLMKVIQMLGSGRVDHKTAGLMLYALQTASSNLRNVDFEASDVTDVVIVRENVQCTDIGGPQWDEGDFEDPEEDPEDEAADETENEIEGEADDEEAVAAAPAQAAVVRKAPAKVRHLTMEEARMQVRGVVQNWLSKSAGENVEVKPG
jgi:hypothetical protein